MGKSYNAQLTGTACSFGDASPYQDCALFWLIGNTVNFADKPDYFLNHPAFQRIAQGETAGVFTTTPSTTADGNLRFAAFRAMDDYPLVLLTGMTQADGTRTAVARQQKYRGAAGIFSVIILTALLVIWRQLNRQFTTGEALLASRKRFQRLFMEAPLGIALIDSLTGHIYEVNPMFAKIVGRSIQEIATIDWMSDITERKRMEREIRHLATHDALTNLPTLRLAHDRLAMALSHAHRHPSKLAVLFIDLDGFKTINDTYGHKSGDVVLKHAAAVLRSAVREDDTVARIGGDEFLIIATDLHASANAELIAEKILIQMAQPMNLNDHKQVTIGASVGIAIYPDNGESLEELIHQADTAMYEAKKRGKNCYVFVT